MQIDVRNFTEMKKDEKEASFWRYAWVKQYRARRPDMYISSTFNQHIDMYKNELKKWCSFWWGKLILSWGLYCLTLIEISVISHMFV